MGALANAATLARDEVFRDRALAALVYQARSIISEPPETPLHDARVSFARAVILSPLAFTETVSWVLAADAEIAKLGSTPSQVGEDVILARTLTAWNYLASLGGRPPGL